MANPHHSEIEVGTAEGRKSWNKATAGSLIDKRCDSFQGGISEFKEALDEANNEFAFSTVLIVIPILRNTDRTANKAAS